jgi:uncharacterized protein (DUF1697 family)
MTSTFPSPGRYSLIKTVFQRRLQ